MSSLTFGMNLGEHPHLSESDGTALRLSQYCNTCLIQCPQTLGKWRMLAVGTVTGRARGSLHQPLRVLGISACVACRWQGPLGCVPGSGGPPQAKRGQQDCHGYSLKICCSQCGLMEVVSIFTSNRLPLCKTEPARSWLGEVAALPQPLQ